METSRAFARHFLEWSKISDTPFLLCLFFIAIFMFAPFLFGGQMFAGNEPVGGYYQYSLFYQDALRTGQSFLWNPHSFGGFPTYLNQFGSFFSPLVQILFTFFPFFFAYYGTVTLTVFAGLAFSFLFGRSFFLSRAASFILALSYCIVQSPDVFQYGLNYAFSFFILPFLLWCVVRAKRAVRIRAIAGYCLLGGAVIGLGFLAGFFVTFLYALVFTGIFVLFLDFYGARLKLGTTKKATLALGCMFVLGVVIGLPQIIPLYEFSPYTSRTIAYAQENTLFSKVVPADFIRIFFPYNLQFPVPGSSSAAFLYFGILPLFLVLIAGLCFYESGVVMFFGLLYILFIVLAMNLPGADWLNMHVPPFNRIGGVGRWLLVGSFAPAFLAGYGFDRLHQVRTSVVFLKTWRWFYRLSLLALAAITLVQIPLGIMGSSTAAQTWTLKKLLELSGRTESSLKYPLEFYTDAIRQQFENLYLTFSFSNPHFIIFLLLSLGGLGALGLVVRSTNLLKAKIAMVSIIGVSCLTLYDGYFLAHATPVGSFFSEAPPAARLMLEREKNTSLYRFASFEGEKLGRDLKILTSAPSPRNVVLAIRELLLFESGTAYGLQSIEGFEQIRSMRQNQLISTALSQHLELAIDSAAIEKGASFDRYINTDILQKVSPEEKASDIVKRLPLLSMMNVKYIISLYPLKSPQLTSLASYHMDSPRLDYTVYENRSVLPRLYFASRPVFWDGSERDLFLAMLDTKDFSKQTYIECADCTTTQSRTSKVEVTHTENGVVEARVSSSAGGWLVYSESNLPGWIAEIDGTRVPIKTANYLFQAIQVPAGEHTVAFRYVGSFELFLERLGIVR